MIFKNRMIGDRGRNNFKAPLGMIGQHLVLFLVTEFFRKLKNLFSSKSPSASLYQLIIA
jgi:hypothetical protein